MAEEPEFDLEGELEAHGFALASSMGRTVRIRLDHVSFIHADGKNDTLVGMVGGQILRCKGAHDEVARQLVRVRLDVEARADKVRNENLNEYLRTAPRYL